MTHAFDISDAATITVTWDGGASVRAAVDTLARVDHADLAPAAHAQRHETASKDTKSQRPEGSGR